MNTSCKIVAYSAIGVSLFLSCQSYPPLLNGDLVFFTSENDSSMDDAIEKSTGEGFVHVGIVEVDRCGKTWLIEATPQKGVCRENLEDRLAKEKFVFKRLKDSTGVATSVLRAKSLIGSPYDFAFLPGNEAYYCSELVYECYLRPDGCHIFSANPMNFLDSEGKLPDYWKKLFESLGMNVPQGVEGTNPEDMSRDDQLSNP